MRTTSRRAAAEGSRAWDRVVADAWPLLQGTIAATLAWVIARYVLGRDDPFFAPIVALIALNASLGERGLNAIRLVQGVFVGIVVGEITLVVLGGSFGTIAVAVFAATALARALDGTRIVIAQAASGAILTVAVGDAQAGLDRLTDALIGAGVALAFSQLLFSPEPLALLRRGEVAVLERLAGALALAARALDEGEPALLERSLAELREAPGDIAELRRLMRASGRVARRTLAWRSQRELLVREHEDADHLDLLAASTLALARTVRPLGAVERAALAPRVRELAEVLAALSGDLGDRSLRQRAADRAFDVANGVAAHDAERGSAMDLSLIALRILAIDVMAFAGVPFDEAVAAVRNGMLEHRVPAPAARPRGLVGRLRSMLRSM